MTTPASPDEEPVVTLLPLQEARGRYRFRSEAYRPSGDWQDLALRRAHLADSADRVNGIAEIAGQLYRTSLHVLWNNPKVAFAEIDWRNMPADVADAPPVPVAYHGYASYLRGQCAFSDSLSTDTRVPLQDVFIPPRFKLMDDGGGTISWRQLRDNARVVMTGAPGAGKSSSLRRLILDLLTADSPEEPGQAVPLDTLPILIQLRDFPVSDFSPGTVSRLVNAERAWDLLAEFRAPLEGRRLLLAIDGLDEITEPAGQELFLDRLDSFCKEVPLVRVILTSRDPVRDDRLRDFTRVHLLPFDPPRAQQWLVLYTSTHETGQSRWGEFTDLIRYDSQLRELSSNPLLLGLATSLHWRYPGELNNRAGLLGKCVDVLIQDWDATRGLARWRDSNVTPRQMKRLLNRLSFLLLQKEDKQFTQRDVSELMSSMTGFREDPDALLSACQTSGLVRKEGGRDQYVFVYAMLADYFAASEMVGRTGEVTEDIRCFSEKEDGSSFWRLTCALATDANELLNAAHMHGSGPESKAEDRRSAAFMLAQALAEEISASPAVVDMCARLVVDEVENRLRDTEVTDELFVRARWRTHRDRQILWAAGAVADTSEVTRADFSTSARLFGLIYRARTGTAGETLRTHLQASQVPLVRQAADAFAVDGWCDHTVTDEDGKTVLDLVVTRSTAETGL
jgi:hypothetical protein